ncbi:MAG: hypothetical protein CO113_11480 [Elusimicrobia bacterium CG_4_9_14_3_um_filter_62_55]|nr:MAG: hypothetical protein COX66_09885 [Elusimicrobia bacterium CG_4_10_14_0_2_um_filter_63_34]PJB24847.1 MAG: hypothetical protein CO113_11480 [Elusimicrobia bacterium CG_4_9_14_3_um_filter_62_55]
MRGFAPIFLLLAVFFTPAPTLQAKDSVEAALEAVEYTDGQLSYAEQQELAAKEAKREKTNLLTQAAKKLQSLPGWRVISKAVAKDKLKARERELERAKAEAARTEKAAVQTGNQYLQAEEQYKAVSGEYRNPERVQYWQSRIGSAGGPPPEEQGEPTTESVGEKTQQLMDTMKGGVTPESMGKLINQAGGLENMTDKLMAQAIQGKGQFNQTAAESGVNGPGIQGGRFRFSDKTGASAYGTATQRQRPPSGSITNEALMDGKIMLTRDRGALGRGKRGLDPWAEKSRQRLASGDYAGALAAAERAIARNPRDPTGYLFKSQALNKLRRFDEAEIAAKRALELDPENEKAYKSLIWAQLHNGKPDEALSNAGRLIRIQPDNAEAFLLRAFANELLGNREAMLRDLERAAALDPKYRGHLAKARRGKRLFDPSAEDSEQLLEAIAYEEAPKRRSSWPLVAIGLAIMIAGAAGPALSWLQGRQRSTVGVGTRTSTLEFERRTARDAAEPELLAGKYRLDQLIGRGGMGKVWKAFDTTLDRPVAVKEMVALDDEDERKALYQLYQKEARTLAALRHPGIVDIYEVVEHQDSIFLIFEWVDGKTVHQILAEEHKLPLHRVVAILEPVCQALSFAHEQGVVHRDLKPANIMVTRDGVVKLMDFGIARAGGDPVFAETAEGRGDPLSANRTQTVAGTPAYRGPEAVRGIVTPAFDIYSLGASFYEMLTGRLPFGPSGQESVHATPFVAASKLAPGLSRSVDALIAFCLSGDYTKRFRDARSLLAELKKL